MKEWCKTATYRILRHASKHDFGQHDDCCEDEFCEAPDHFDTSLVVAAPDMLEALEDIVAESECHGGGSDTMYECIEEMRNTAKAAIAKAKE